MDPAPDSTIYKQEIFGPVVVISSFKDEAEVLERANATEFGLSGVVFSQDVNRALRVAVKSEVERFVSIAAQWLISRPPSVATSRVAGEENWARYVSEAHCSYSCCKSAQGQMLMSGLGWNPSIH